MVTIYLTPDEVANAQNIATLKAREQTDLNLVKIKIGDANSTRLQRWQKGCTGEQAVAKYLGVPYTFRPYNVHDYDVAGYEVRATNATNGHLITHNKDKQGIYVLAIVDAPNVVTLAGWSNLRRCNTPKRWATWLRVPAYATPRAELWPMDMMPATVLYRCDTTT
jgi:hypothetical protein